MIKYSKMRHNDLEELTICVCDYFEITKKELITNRYTHFISKARQMLIHLAIKYDIKDKYTLSFFLDIPLDTTDNCLIKMTNRLLLNREILHEYKVIESNFLNKKLSIYEN